MIGISGSCGAERRLPVPEDDLIDFPKLPGKDRKSDKRDRFGSILSHRADLSATK